MIELRIKAASGAILPKYATAGSAGADLYAHIQDPEGLCLEPGQKALVPTGLFMEIPQGYEVQIRPRSGLAAKFGVTVLNTPGTIDSDYRGEVKVILINHGSDSYIVNEGDRIAQMVIASVIQCDFTPVDEINSSERGVGGFGSTGK